MTLHECTVVEPLPFVVCTLAPFIKDTPEMRIYTSLIGTLSIVPAAYTCTKLPLKYELGHLLYTEMSVYAVPWKSVSTSERLHGLYTSGIATTWCTLYTVRCVHYSYMGSDGSKRALHSDQMHVCTYMYLNTGSHVIVCIPASYTGCHSNTCHMHVKYAPQGGHTIILFPHPS